LNKAAFGDLFRSALTTALHNAERHFGRRLPHHVDVKLYGVGRSGVVLGVEEVIDTLFIDEDTFHQIIDVAIAEVGERRCLAFVRVSDRPPVAFHRTRNDPRGTGPFKQLVAQELKALAE
jgi:hypothetical protein